MTKANHGMSSCRGAAAPPGSWWRRRRREESSPCCGPRTAGLPQPLRRRPSDPPRLRPPYPNPPPQTHDPRLRQGDWGREPKRRIQQRPEPETPAQDEAVGGSADASSSIPAAASSAQSTRAPREVPPRVRRACRRLVKQVYSVSGGGRGPRRPPPPVAVRPAPLSAPNLLIGGGGGRWRPLFCVAASGASLEQPSRIFFLAFFRFAQWVGLGARHARRGGQKRRGWGRRRQSQRDGWARSGQPPARSRPPAG